MFFTMLKNDLKSHKGLNIILFIFILSASVVSVIAANLMYMEITGRTSTDRISNIANAVVNVNVGVGNFDEKKETLAKWAEDNSLIYDSELKEYIRLDEHEIQINGLYASDDTFPSFNKSFHITTNNKHLNLLYTDKNEPFSVDTGEVAISVNLADLVGVHRGDEINVTSQLGNIYTLKISDIYKDPSDTRSDELIISDADYEKIKPDFPFRICKIMVKTDNMNTLRRITKELEDVGLAKACSGFYYSPETDMNHTILIVVSSFLLAISIVIMVIMFITIRYMMVAAIKREEKEIGMMRAIGVDSFRYRWLFAALYISFAFIGGIVGFVAGVPITKIIMRKLCKNYINSNPYMIQIIAVVVSICMVAAIIGFSAVMMRRIRKISVIDAIHGTAAGERFSKLNRMNLYTIKKLKVPEFLAIGNIVNGFGKYLFLVITYSLAVMVLLTVFNIKSSLLSPDYQRNFLELEHDFYIYMNEEFYQYYYQKGGDYEGAMKLIVEDFNNQGIPVKMRYMNGCEAEILRGDKDNIGLTLLYGDTYNEGIPLRKGGKLPVKENEIILSYFTAKKEGIKIGDTLTIELEEYGEDKISTNKVQRDFIVTGFYDIMEGGEAGAIAGREYSGASKDVTLVTNLLIDAPKKEKKRYFEKLQEIYGDETIVAPIDVYKDGMGYVTDIVDYLKIIVTILMAFVLILNTGLYMSVDLARETPGIAMLKSVGFSNDDIKRWHMFRMLIILVVSFILAYILEYTVVNLFAQMIFLTFGITRFHFISNPIEACVIIPGIVLLIGYVAMKICLMKVKNINIWNIREG